MALIAGHATGVFDGRHLGEGARFGGVLLVAAPAEVGYLGQLRNVGGRVVGMQRQRSMTGFAGHVSVLARRPRGGFGIVAEHAGILPCECDRPLSDQRQRTRTVVAVLAKGFGDNRTAHRQEYAQAGQQNQGWANQMTGVLYQTAHCSLFPRDNASPTGNPMALKQYHDQQAELSEMEDWPGFVGKHNKKRAKPTLHLGQFAQFMGQAAPTGLESRPGIHAGYPYAKM